MGAEILEIDRRLSRFDQRNTPAGLLCRYAAGRVKHFLSRQVLTLSGAVSLVVLEEAKSAMTSKEWSDKMIQWMKVKGCRVTCWSFRNLSRARHCKPAF